MMSDTNNKNPCTQKPCQSRPFERGPDLSSEDEMKGRPVLYAGVLWIGVLRKFLVPRREECECQPESPRPTHISGKLHDHHAQPPPLTHKKPPEIIDCEQFRRREKIEDKPSTLASLVYQIQDVSAVVVGEAKQLSDEINELVQDGKATTSEAINTMRRDNAVAQRYCAIATSGLTGYMAGWRRGMFSRLVYSLTSAAAMAAVCYPQDTRRYNSQGLEVVQRAVEHLLPKKKTSLEVKYQKNEANSKNKKPTSSQQPDTILEPESFFEKVPSTNNNNMSSTKKNFSPLHRFQMQDRLNQDVDKTVNEQNNTSPKQPKTNSAVTIDDPEDLQLSSKGKLAKECCDSVRKGAPCSHAPPEAACPLERSIPPENSASSNQFYSSTIQTESKRYTSSDRSDTQELNNKPSEESTNPVEQEVLKDVSNRHNLHNSYGASDFCREKSELGDKQFNIINPDENSMISVNKSIKHVQDSSVGESMSKALHYYPLNKKLNQYYMERKEQSASSLGMIHDNDLQQKKKKK